MQSPLLITNSISIKASISMVWDALINPEKTKIYMYGCETVSDWEIGSTLLWKGSYEGKEMIFVKGTVLELVPEKKLTYSVFDPNSTMPDIPENYLSVTYDLNSENGNTILTVTQGDYSKVAEGQRRYEQAYDNGEGWNPILNAIKKMIEST